MISVVIPVYKNKPLFIKNLEKNLNFLKDCQIIIVNDSPQEKLKKDIENLIKKKGRIDNVIIIENKKNLGFGQSVNIGTKYAKGDYLFLLNTDVILNNKNYFYALNHFKKNPNLFAVSFAQLERNNQIVGKNIIYFKDGLFHHKKTNNLNFGKNAWAEGGACIIDKKKFNYLGGFDSLYSPFYWEDVDLSYRAWKAGFEIIFDPKILVKHHHESTIGKYFDKNKIKIIAYRNQLIFTFKNLSDRKLFFNFLFFLFKNFIKSLFIFNYLNLIAFINFLSKIPLILIIKEGNRKKIKIKDNMILSYFRND